LPATLVVVKAAKGNRNKVTFQINA